MISYNQWTMSDMVKYRAVNFKKDQIAALYFTMSDKAHGENIDDAWVVHNMNSPITNVTSIISIFGVMDFRSTAK